MSQEEVNIDNFVLPSSQEDRKRIRNMLYEITAQMQMISDRREAIKDIVDVIHEEFKLPKKIINQLARTLFKHNYEDVTHESTIFEIVYEGILASGSPHEED